MGKFNDEDCGTKEVVLAQFDPRADVHLHIKNRGTCPIKARFERKGTKVHVRTVHPKDTKDIYRDDITAIILDCLGKPCDEENCAATYRIEATSAQRVRSACGGKAGEISYNRPATITVKVVNTGGCRVKVEFKYREGAGPVRRVHKLLVPRHSEDSKTVDDVNRIFFTCTGEDSKQCVFSYEVTIK